MPRQNSSKKRAAANAREAKARKRLGSDEPEAIEDHDVTTWTGGVNNHLLQVAVDDGNPDFVDEEDDDEDVIEELQGDELVESLQLELEHELSLLGKESVFKVLMEKRLTNKQWKKAGQKRCFGYDGNAERTARKRRHDARKKEEDDKKLRASKDAAMFRGFFKPKATENVVPAQDVTEPSMVPADPDSDLESIRSGSVPIVSDEIFTGYLSDVEDDDGDFDQEGVVERVVSEESDQWKEGNRESQNEIVVQQPPMLKRRRHEIPVREQRKQKKLRREKELTEALITIEKLIASKKEIFMAGRNGLQAYRARAIQSHLHMMVKNGRGWMDASARAAEAQGFSPNWGARLVRRWTKHWVVARELPESDRGRHVKVFSLLEDPAIRAELRSYLRSNKWAMNPAKLAEYTKTTAIPAAAEKYIRHIVDEEMPRGLKKYMELELFPRIGYKVVKGVSLETARGFLLKEGFKFTEHKKALFYDGHDRPDVVDYRQTNFIPFLDQVRPRILEYSAEDLSKEVVKQPPNLVERRVAVCPHDEMTTQQNDGERRSWVLDGEYALKKKGNGRGLHTSGVICSTHGYLHDAEQRLEYGKNYEGYWNGELFVKQLKEKIIPEFEHKFGPGFQALFLIDNSQGHSAYPLNALLVSRMNFRPGGKQAVMRDGWFMRNGEKIVQPMIFPPDHPQFPGQPKGMRQVLVERELWSEKLLMQCKDDCTSNTCCAKRILELQPDFQGQQSLVQEVIEKAGHLCLFLPKFHCELNYIEYFWGATKRWLREHCDYTFSGLQENLPRALRSVPIETVRRWENRFWRWVGAYKEGMSSRDAQFKVKQFGSRKYTSHRRVPETLARQFD